MLAFGIQMDEELSLEVMKFGENMKAVTILEEGKT